MDSKLSRRHAGYSAALEPGTNGEQPARQFLGIMPPVRSPECQSLVTICQVAFQSIATGSAELVDKLHGIGEHDQPLTPEPAHDGILESRGVLVLISDDRWVTRLVSVVNGREALDERPKERSQVIEHEPSGPLFRLYYCKQNSQALLVGSSVVPELGKCVLSEGLDEPLASREFPHEF